MKRLRWLTMLLLLAGPSVRAGTPAFEIRAVAERPDPPAQGYLQTATEGGKPEKIYLEPEVLLGLAAVRSASALYVYDDRWTVRLTLTGEGSERLAEITTRYLGKRIAILVDGKVFTAATVRAVVKGSLDVGSDLPADAACGLADDLNAAVARAAAATPDNP